VRGQYIHAAGADPVEEHAFLLVGSADDSGNLKGFLRKAGRRFEQDAVIWKGYYRDVLFFALNNLPAIGMEDSDIKNLGQFHPNHIGHYHALMTRWTTFPHVLADSAEHMDWAAEHWKHFGIWTQPTSGSRRVVFDQKGN
jgi:hypothetical protein